MINIEKLSNYELLLHALDRISINEQVKEQVVNDSQKEDYAHHPFNILRYIEDPS